MYKSAVYTETSHDVKIVVKPTYVEDESDVITGKYVFVYFITIENLGSEPVKLLRRHWSIEDSAGETYEVNGDGVVGRQPVIQPGKSHNYNSYCVLKSMSGSMQGHYIMQKESGEQIQVSIPRFVLRSHLLN
ncbi:MAG: Co2+/Mg2+ efflux protein ApaG [Balneolia bacterium]|nr:Co2+/Mg2+ efflux protein ApaG [Balneolia bacterium]